MSKASVDSEHEWLTVAHERPSGLEVVLLKRTYILPWSQFLYAEGGDDEVRVVFATHDVMIRGSGLSSLLSELAAQRVARLDEPTRSERLDAAGSRIVRELRVQKAGERTS
jgi:hypothetical protein